MKIYYISHELRHPYTFALQHRLFSCTSTHAVRQCTNIFDIRGAAAVLGEVFAPLEEGLRDPMTHNFQRLYEVQERQKHK
jgi:hypothetical protein